MEPTVIVKLVLTLNCAQHDILCEAGRAQTNYARHRQNKLAMSRRIEEKNNQQDGNCQPKEQIVRIKW